MHKVAFSRVPGSKDIRVQFSCGLDVRATSATDASRLARAHIATSAVKEKEVQE
jgi:hypothetical protein